MTVNILYLIKEEFERRRARNKYYSLRSFARDLEIPAPKLSEYLNGKRRMAKQRIEQVGKKLGLESRALDTLICAEEAHYGRSARSRESAKRNLQTMTKSKWRQIELDMFSFVRDWYHMAILELMETADFKPDVAWVAKRLGLSKGQAVAAIDRMEQMGLIEKTPKKWIQKDPDLETTVDIPNSSIAEFHRQILDQAQKKLDQIRVERREYCSMVMAFDESQLPELKKHIRQFQSVVADLCRKGKNKKSVYAFNVQLFPLSRKEEET